MAKTNDIENPYIPNYEEYIRQKEIGGFACTYDIIPGSAERKRRKCNKDEIAILRTVRQYDTETEKQIAIRLGKPEAEVKSLIATLIKDRFLERNNYRGQDYWELVY